MKVQIQKARAKRPMKMKMLCHSPTSRITWPMPGATMGMAMNTMKVRDMTSAISRPE
jgi:hypothetical protein